MLMYALAFLLGLLTRHCYEVLWTKYSCPQCHRAWSLKYFRAWQNGGPTWEPGCFEAWLCLYCGSGGNNHPHVKPNTGNRSTFAKSYS